MTAQALGPRDRHKQKTNALISRAALTLARDHDVNAVTVEAICAEAGVSVRTFFNYFPYREAAFAPPPPPLPAEAVARFLEGQGRLLEALCELLAAQVASVSREPWISEVLRRLRRDQPKIEALLVRQLHLFDDEMAMLIARRQGLAAPDQACHVVATAVLAALRVVLDDAAGKQTGPDAADVRHGLGQLEMLCDVVMQRLED